MSVSGIGTTHYPIAGYETRKAESVVPQKSFSDVVSEKAIEKKDDINEKAFEYIAPNAPESVKQAWIEAAKETGANGLGIKGNGMLSHISQMMVQRLNKMIKGEGNAESLDILGSTTESAILATKQALYNLEHPIVYTPKSIEVQQACIKEREFYIAFLEKLQNL
ncbi:MAG: hypothetical protein HDQ97_09265 [Lachnospiraceae bacterium]|nr:hypothetical protein [Lachnospiraceae bacterium]